ncbi:MAG: ABC transporter ATP-binding protein [Lachnospiraceae bacterium]|jgi:ATP-binding cassette subfamily B protein|nr:ABC transporter ATP-binding protein [Lachnospiraceae bacterium]
MKTILYYLKPYHFRMLRGFLVKILGTFADLGLPWVLAYILDDVVPLGRISLVLWWGVVMFFLAVAARLLNIRANRMASKVARDTIEEVRHDLFHKIMYLSGNQTDRIGIPSLISRLTADSYNVHSMIGRVQRIGVRAPIILMGGILITFTLEPVLTLVLIATLPLLSVLVYRVSKKGIPLYTKVSQSVDGVVRIMRENINGIRVVKALSKTDYEYGRFKEQNGELAEHEFKAGITMALSGPMMNLILNLGLTAIVVVGAYRVNAGASMPGRIVAFLSYFTMILHAMMAITRVFVDISKAAASANRIGLVLSEGDELLVRAREADKLSGEDATEIPPRIEFLNVSFGYHAASGGEDKLCLKNLNFRIMPGESLGILGATGSGKSTVINLLMRFYDVNSGSVRVDGRDVREYTPKELREKFAVVFQNDTVFHDSIMENICFGREIGEEEVMAAAKDACAYDFIMEKEDGFLSEAAIGGANLSGGQKQRLLITRALAGKPEILVLDDSSSALDYKTDAKLRRAIRKHYAGTNIVMVAQRVSSLMGLDHILVLEDGEAIGYGGHEELLKDCEVYREIYEVQMGSMEGMAQ